MSAFPALSRTSAVALGFFDGVHIGHQLLLRELAGQDGLDHVVFTFQNHPISVLHPSAAPPHLTSFAEKKDLLARYGAEHVVAPVFDRDFATMPAQDFAGALFTMLRAKVVILGENYRFGHGAQGDAALLGRLAGRYGAQVCVLPVVMADGSPVSSTRVRACLSEGDVAGAMRLLGRPYSVAGPVAHGRKIGSLMRLPTANVEAEPGRALPKDGVYAAFVRVDGEVHRAVANIGANPTVGGVRRTLEAHLLNYPGGDLYGKQCEALFIQRLRDVKRFSSMDELREQILVDSARGQEILACAEWTWPAKK